jgi:putative metal-binding protein
VVDAPVVIATEPGALRTELARYTTAPDTTAEPDEDGDGVPARLDLDDSDPAVGVVAEEIPCSGFDEDGDGVDLCPSDVDADGARADIDCDDLDALKGPFAVEVRCNGLDENCDGHDDCDQDEDGLLDWADPDPNDPAPPEEVHAVFY